MQAFPAGSGPMDRTTYMFTYVDPQPGCPTLEDLLEDYWDLMPKYQVDAFKVHFCIPLLWLIRIFKQGVSLDDDLQVLRVIFGIFPTYRDR